jgi:hypothetical protein
MDYVVHIRSFTPSVARVPTYQYWPHLKRWELPFHTWIAPDDVCSVFLNKMTGRTDQKTAGHWTNITRYYWSVEGDINQVVRRWLLTAGPGLQSQVISCEIRVWRSGNVTCFLRLFFPFPLIIIIQKLFHTDLSPPPGLRRTVSYPRLEFRASLTRPALGRQLKAVTLFLMRRTL